MKLLAVPYIIIALSFCLTQKINSQTNNHMMITKTIDTTLPTIGILIFEEFLTNEVVAPMDVFTKKDIGGKQLFNVILIAKEDKIYISEEDLKVLPDFTINNTPELNVLIVPSSNHPDKQINDTVLINFIKEHGKTADYIASHCAGAFMLGEAGVADNKKIVTYETGSAALQKQYPKLLVMDDEIVSVVQDGNMITSNGGLVSYIASLDLLEQMTNNTQRKYVEEQLLINKLKQ